jgi:ABC-type transport system substrate-binding protein
VKACRHLVQGIALLCVVLGISAAVAAPVADTQPKKGGTLHLWEQTDLRSLDPAIAFDSESGPITRLLFRGLLDYDNNGNVVPGQIKDWNISPDGKTYTFHLLPAVRFADGTEVEAEDYVFSFERILDPATSSPGQDFFTVIAGAPEFVAGKTNHVSGLSAPDKQTLVIRLQKPTFTFRNVLAMTIAAAEPRELVRRYGKDFQYHLIGSGPYRLTEWRRGIRWRMVRNPYYTGPDGYVDGVDIMVGGDSATAVMMLERNEVDVVTIVSPVDAVRFERDPRLRSWLVRVPVVGTDYLFMNTEMKPFDNVLLRRAVSYAVNKPRLVKLTGGFYSVANGIVPPTMPWTNSALPDYGYEPDKARALLREAGYPNGLKTTLEYIQDGSVFPRLAEGVQQDLREIGIDADLRPVNFSAFIMRAGSRRQLPFGVWGWFQDYPDPSDFLNVLFNGAGITESDCNNIFFYNNPKVNELLDTAAQSVDPDERTRNFRKAEAAILQDAPVVPLTHDVMPVLYNPRVHGVQPHPVWLWRFEWMWLDPQ